ncbi:hypothetical protein M9435_002317 [Picochlorum sp. BPE23]|nr:hypothetical protein M9435_002317 [Picochlorum sp. BPE23]
MLHSHGYRRRVKAVRKHRHAIKGKSISHKITFWGKWERIWRDIGGTTHMALTWLLAVAAAVLGWVWEALSGNVIPAISRWLQHACERGEKEGGECVKSDSPRSIETRVVDALKEDLAGESVEEERLSLLSLPSSPTTPILSQSGGQLHMHRDEAVEFSPTKDAHASDGTEGRLKGRHSRKRRSRKKAVPAETDMHHATKVSTTTQEEARERCDEIKAMHRDGFSSPEKQSSSSPMWRTPPPSVSETPFLVHQNSARRNNSGCRNRSRSTVINSSGRAKDHTTPLSEGQDSELAGAWLAASMATANLGLDTYETDSQVVEAPATKQMGSSRSIVVKNSIASAFSDVSWTTSGSLSFTSSSLPSTSFSVAQQHSSDAMHPVQSSSKEDTKLHSTIISSSFQNIRDIWEHESEE